MTFTRMLSRQKIIDELKASNLPVVIFGASTVGKAIQKICEEEGIRVDCYCDNKNYKMERTYNGLHVVNPQYLKDRYDNAEFIITAADISDVVNQLQTLSFDRWYAGGLLLQNYDFDKTVLGETEEFSDYVIGACVNCHDAFLSGDRIFMRSVDLVVTERCSLKCKDCSNMMQYYRKPVNYELGQMQQSVDNLLKLVDGIQEFRVIGGEPFMNKNFHIVVQRLINEAAIERIVIYTNGTIAPSDEKLEMMKSSKVMVLITDYGDLSGNKQKLMDRLQAHGIAYHIDTAKGWTDCSAIQPHNRTDDEQAQIFTDCCAKSLITISNGHLYRCPYSANASQLKAVPDEASDYLDIEHLHELDESEARAVMRSFLTEKKFLKVCDFCNGRPLNAPEIIPGIQTRKPLEYEILAK